MLQKLALFILTCYVVIVVSNPIDPSTALFISEAQIIDSLTWSVELNSKEYVGQDKTIRGKTRDTTAAIKLVLKSKTYNTKLFFDSLGIAVLNRQSIVGIPAQEKVIIQDNDTIKVTTAADTIHGSQMYFYFNLRPVKKGNSLVRIYYGLTPFETSRASIGKPNGPFSTDYNFTVTDKNLKPVSDVFIYRYFFVTMPYVDYLGRTDKSGNFHYTINMIMPVQSTIEINQPVQLYFFRDSIPNYSHPKSSSDNMGSVFIWKGNYNDTVQSKDVPIVIDMTNTVSKVNINYDFNFKLTQLSDKKQVLIILSTVQPLANAFVNISNLNGRVISSMHIPMPQKGTYSFIFDPKKNAIATGHYICSLVADNKVRAVHPLIIK